MSVHCTQREDGVALQLEGALTIMDAAALRDQLALALVTANGPVEVDLSRVTDIDSTGLQLLLALLRESVHVRIGAMSAMARSRIERFGLLQALRLEGGLGDGA